MKINYSELYYGSTQQSILSGLDGFGIRTHTRDLNKALMEAIKSRNLFYYTAGNKPLAGTFELIQQPDLVYSYPKSFSFFKEVIEHKTYYILARTIFLGRDYGWYLREQEEGARSGNTFSHLLFFEEMDFKNSIKYGGFNQFFPQFVPINYQNNPDNLELRKLLTNEFGEPNLLPLRELNLDITKNTSGINELTIELVNGILAIYQAIQLGKKLLITKEEVKTLPYINALFDLLPNALISTLNFATNYHEYNLDSEYKVLFLNEYYSRPIPNNDSYFIVCDYLGQQFSAPLQTDFYRFLKQIILDKEFLKLKQFNRDFDEILTEVSSEIDFNQIYYAWLYLYSREEYDCEFDPDTVFTKIQDYGLSDEFKLKIGTNIYRSFVNAIVNHNHQKIANSLQLIEKLNYSASNIYKVKQAFSTYFFQKNNPTFLFKYTNDKERIFRFLLTENLREHYLEFFTSNRLSLELSDFFALKFCLAKPAISVQLIGYCYSNRLLSKTFGNYLKEQMGEPQFLDFLKDKNFFIYTDREVQLELFGDFTRDYIFQLAARGEEGLDEATFFIEERAEKASFFRFYLNDLTENILESENQFQTHILLMNGYLNQFRKGIWSAKDLKQMDALVTDMMDAFLVTPDFKTAQKLYNLMGRFQRALPQLQSNSQQEAFQIEHYQRLIRFISCILESRLEKDLDKLDEMEVPTEDSESILAYLQFVLANIPIIKWQSVPVAEKLCKKIIAEKYFFQGKYVEENENYTLLDFIPHFYTWLLFSRADSRSEIREDLKDFYCSYTLALWNLRISRKEDYKDTDELLTTQILYNKMAKYLKALKKIDRGLCIEVLRYIENHVPDPSLYLTLQKRVDTDSGVTKLFKLIKKFSLPKKTKKRKR